MKRDLNAKAFFIGGIVLILILQGYWAINMYQTVLKSTVDKSLSALKYATKFEIIRRTEATNKSFRKIKVHRQPYNLTENADFIIPINELNKANGNLMSLSVVDSVFSSSIVSDLGIKPKYVIQRARNKSILDVVRNSGSLTHVIKTKGSYLIVQKIGFDEWIELELLNPKYFVFQKAFWLFLSSILIVITLCIIILTQFRSVQQDRRFVKFIVDFTHMLAHDLRNPISSVNMLLLKMNKDVQIPLDVRKRYLNEGYDLSNRILRNLDNLLYLADNQKTQMLVRKMPVILLSTINRLLSGFKNRDYSPKIVTFTTDIKDDFTIYVDIPLFENVISNLIENAIKYSGIQTEIYISALQLNSSVIISIRDNGYGISLENQKKVFDIFERGDAEGQPALPGFGLGLHFVQKAVQAHGGKVFVKSEIGKGTEFSIVLPLEN